MFSTCGKDFVQQRGQPCTSLRQASSNHSAGASKCNLLRHPSIGPSSGSVGVSGYSQAQVYRLPAPLLSLIVKPAFVNWHRRLNRRAFLNLHKAMIPQE
jgi:hypothetical protein